MAMTVLQRAYASGRLKPGDRIVGQLGVICRSLVRVHAPVFSEATSGNTGISFCALGRALGHPVTIFMPDWMSAERKVTPEPLFSSLIFSLDCVVSDSGCCLCVVLASYCRIL